ncbi:MAG: TPM domain-containing protein [Clostridia bacterium]|nr:TPM domain-containing protein [Clostridia bacterium]
MKRLLAIAAAAALLFTLSATAFAENVDEAVDGMQDAASDIAGQLDDIAGDILGDVFGEDSDVSWFSDAVGAASTLVDASQYISRIPGAPSRPTRVYDEAEIFDDDEVEKLQVKFDSLAAAYDFDFAVVTTTGLLESQMMDFADDVYDYGGYGMGDDHDGTLLLISMNGTDGNHIWITTTGRGIEAVNEYCIDKLMWNIFDQPLADRDFYKVGMRYGKYVAKMVKAYDAGNGYDYSHTLFFKEINWLGSGLFAAIIALVVTLIKRRSNKKAIEHAVRKKTGAADYTVPGSMSVTGSFDRFINSSTSRTPRQTSSSSSGGRSSGGGGSHTSSSGSSHGGGGRSF